MRQLSTSILLFVRSIKAKRVVTNQPDNQDQKPDRIKFTEDQITQMGQYRMRAKSRHFPDIFKDKIEDKKHKDYLKNQKQKMRSDEQYKQDMINDQSQFQEQKQDIRMQKKQKTNLRQKFKTFRIYKHQQLLKKKMQKQKNARQARQSNIDELKLQQLAKVRLIEQYLPYEYMKNVQKIFHKYDQAQLRDIAFHFTNLMKLRYSQQKINYDLYPHLNFQKLQQKLPLHRKVQQIYLTSKTKALQEKKQQRKVDKQPIQSQIKYSQNIVVSYLLNRVPRTYSVAFRVINQIKKMYENYKPTSFIDFGAGLSSGAIAFSQIYGDTGSIYTVQPAGKLRKLGKFLTDYSKIIHFQSLAELSSQVRQVDIVYCGYVLNQIRPQLVLVYLQSLFSKVKPQGFLVLVEYGNPFGSRLIHEARKWALTKRIKIAAPCPHHYKCPLANSNHWCHFDQPAGMYPREVFGKLPSDNSIKLEKFSYIILQKLQQQVSNGQKYSSEFIEPNQTHGWDRILFPLIRRGKHFIFTTCTVGGRFQKRVVGKSHGQQYKLGRKLRWGDFWRFGQRIPNRYRKERRTGRRLW